MFERAIDELKQIISVYRRSHAMSKDPDTKIQIMGLIQELEQAIELLKNPKRFDESDMLECVKWVRQNDGNGNNQSFEEWIEYYKNNKNEYLNKRCV